MIIAFADFETTAFPNWSMPHDDDSQPWTVSQGVIKRNDFKETAVHYCLVKAPAASHPDALAVHGLTADFLDENGVTPTEAVTDFLNCIHDIDLFVSHNKNFDRKILLIAISRFLGDACVKAFEDVPTFCTMSAYRSMTGAKKYNLDAACFDLLGMPPRGEGVPHTSLDDARRCMALFDALVVKGHGPRGYRPKAA